MSTSARPSRRALLGGAALAAGALVLQACSPDESKTGSNGPKPKANPAGKGSETKPLPVPKKFGEAPDLTAQVKAGKLPAVAERLPQQPYVVPHRWLQPGKYGGELNLPCSDDMTYSPKEYFYGHSPLRWINDGKDIAPGLVESWESDADSTTWTLHFRKGLKWSDGQPWTTADVMFWWEDMVLNEEYAEGIPDVARSGTGTIAKFSAPDDTTIVMKFDAPSPMVPEMLANWVKRGIDATWMEPKHYMQQFHPKYNKKVPKDWTTKFDSMRDHTRNTKVPTMNGWQVATYDEGRSMTWKRNPYYWVVDKQGNQLPYIDMLTFEVVAQPETRRLKIHNGDYDYVHGPFYGVSLADVAPLRREAAKNKYQMIMWDSGSGTGSMFFFSQDYNEPKMRKLIREPKFRQALSHAFNREDVRKGIYFNAGELTTGGYGPKTLELTRGEGPSMYKKWRDSFVKYDPELAKKMLDELGVVDKNGDGKREMPDGTKLVISLDYPSDEDASGEHLQKNQLLKKNWDAIGLDTRLNPVPASGFDDQWNQGRVMSKTAWEVSTVTVAADMLWLMPMEPSRWAPLQGQFYSLRGTPDEKKQLDVDPYKRTPPRMEPEKGGPVERLWSLAGRVRVETDALKRDALIWEMLKVHIEEGPFFIGSVANYPRVELVKEGLRNIPTKEQTGNGGLVNDWHHPTPAAYDPESWFWA
ncbi:ABC transporter substrate-binding protein [Flindersiella endophytica]